MTITTVSYRTSDGKKHTVVLSRNTAVKLLVCKFDGEVSDIKVKEVAC